MVAFTRKYTCKSNGDLDTYIRLNLPASRIDKSNKNGCTVCDERKYHKMTYIERWCKCKLPHCNLETKILKCERHGVIYVYQKGDNIHELNEEEEIQSQSQQQQHGIHETIKTLIKEMCDESEELTPMAIHTRIIRNHRRKKYNFSAAIIPTLNKVINFSLSLLYNHLFLTN